MSDVRLRPESERFRNWLGRLWAELATVPRPAEFLNLEGGGVEQVRDPRLLLHHCANYAAVLTVLADKPEAERLELLELGCGSGSLSFAFARVMPKGWRLVATDYSERLIASARQRFQQENLRFEFLDARSLRPEVLAKFDAVFLLEVIEHLVPDETVALLRQLHEVMKPESLLIISTLDRSPFPRAFSGYPPHKREFSFEMLCQFLLEKSPFKDFEIYRLVSPRIAAEEVSAENRGGYLVNRFQRLVMQVTDRFRTVALLRQKALGLGFRLYALLPQHERFDFNRYLETITIVRAGPSQADRYDQDSFGLVAVLKKGKR